ncbi:MAG: hypothetical protein AB4041_22240 [Microcystaceae cyanobacterium]
MPTVAQADGSVIVFQRLEVIKPQKQLESLIEWLGCLKGSLPES